jgi:hypothetical protein
MTKKDYELIAGNIKAISKWQDIKPATALLIASMFAEDLETTNPRFNRDLFLTACGVK